MASDPVGLSIQDGSGYMTKSKGKVLGIVFGVADQVREHLWAGGLSGILVASMASGLAMSIHLSGQRGGKRVSI